MSGKAVAKGVRRTAGQKTKSGKHEFECNPTGTVGSGSKDNANGENQFIRAKAEPTEGGDVVRKGTAPRFGYEVNEKNVQSRGHSEKTTEDWATEWNPNRQGL